MTPNELITTAARRWLNDETAATYKWTQAELVDYYNAFVDDISRETDYILDSSTSSVSEIIVSAGTADYAYSSLMVNGLRVYMSGSPTPLGHTTVGELIQINDTWRYLASVAGTDISFADNTPNADTIISTTTEFVDVPITADDWIVVNGSTSNNNTVQVATVAAHLLTLKATATMTTEAAGDSVLLRVINTGTPTNFLFDYRSGYITMYPCPDEAGKLILETSRYQVTPMTVAALATATAADIPIDSHYHMRMIDGILKYAYLKSGPSTFNIEKATVHGNRAGQLINDIKRDLIRLRASRKPMFAHQGTI